MAENKYFAHKNWINIFDEFVISSEVRSILLDKLLFQTPRGHDLYQGHDPLESWNDSILEVFLLNSMKTSCAHP